MSRLDNLGSVADMIGAMAEGNFGAVAALVAMINVNEKVDPDSVFGDFSAMFTLDDLQIYGPGIHILFKDVCEQNPVLLIAVLRAYTSGLITESTMKQASFRGPREEPKVIDAKHYYEEVKKLLPNFDQL